MKVLLLGGYANGTIVSVLGPLCEILIPEQEPPRPALDSVRARSPFGARESNPPLEGPPRAWRYRRSGPDQGIAFLSGYYGPPPPDLEPIERARRRATHATGGGEKSQGRGQEPGLRADAGASPPGFGPGEAPPPEGSVWIDTAERRVMIRRGEGWRPAPPGTLISIARAAGVDVSIDPNDSLDLTFRGAVGDEGAKVVAAAIVKHATEIFRILRTRAKRLVESAERAGLRFIVQPHHASEEGTSFRVWLRSRPETPEQRRAHRECEKHRADVVAWLVMRERGQVS